MLLAPLLRRKNHYGNGVFAGQRGNNAPGLIICHLQYLICRFYYRTSVFKCRRVWAYIQSAFGISQNIMGDHATDWKVQYSQLYLPKKAPVLTMQDIEGRLSTFTNIHTINLFVNPLIAQLLIPKMFLAY